MIDLKHYNEILDKGLMLDHYLILCKIRDGETINKTKRVQGFINLLNKKGYIDNEELTDLAIQLLDKEPDTSSPEVTETEQPEFMSWVIKLHKNCQNKIKELTGGKQIKSKIKGGGSYWFLCNARDMANALNRAITIYKLDDREAIEKALISHIENCNQNKDWFPIMKYFIIKGKSADCTSDMVTQMENSDNNTTTKKSTQKFV